MSGGRDHVCQMAPTGASKTITTATLGLTNVHNPSWSPDSTSIAFGANDASGNRAIYRMSRTGASLRNLRPAADGNVGGHGPTWSPDGTRIAFEEHVSNGVFGIRTISAVDGSDPRLMGFGIDGLINGFDPSGWQPLP